MPYIQASALADLIESRADWSGRSQLVEGLRALGADANIPVVADCAVTPSGSYVQQELTDVVTSLNAVIDALQALGLVTAT